MLLLTLGVALWWVAHLQKRLRPALRRDLEKALGEGPSKGVISLVIGISLALMIIGYRSAEFVPVYTPLAGIGHLNNLLMLVAIFLMGVGPAGGVLSAKIRHPMLIGGFLWGVAHLLVNGDLASVILFGGIAAWVPLQMRVINASEGPWERPMPGNALQDGKLALLTLFLFVVIAGVHWLFGMNVFQGTFG